MDRTRVLGIETSLRRDGGRRRRRRRVRCCRRWCRSQVDLHARFGGVVPEIASRAHVELLTPVVAQALVEAGIDDDHVDAVAATVGPGLVGALLVGVSAAKALALVVGRALRGRQPPRGPPLRRAARGPRPRPPGGRAAGVGRPHAAGPRWRATAATGCWARRSTTPPARRSTRSPATSGSATPAVRPSTAIAMEGDPEAIAFPRAMLDDGLRLLLLGAQDGGGEPRPQAPRRRHRRRGRLVPGGGGRRAGHQGPVAPLASTAPRACAWPAAWRPTRSCASGSSTPAWPTACEPFLPSRSMCTDNAAMVAAAAWYRLAGRRPVAPRHRRPPQPAAVV